MFVERNIKTHSHNHFCRGKAVNITLNVPSIQSVCCCIPSVVFEVRYAGVDRAAGYRGMLVEVHSDHLRINIHDSKPNSLGV
jgi:hypothetical protein